MNIEERVRKALCIFEKRCAECQEQDLQDCLPPYPQCVTAGCHVGRIVRVLKDILGGG